MWGDCLAGAPCPHPPALRSSPWPRGRTWRSDPLPWLDGGGVGASRGAELQPCFVRCTLPSTSGAARGWGREASALAFPTPDPELLRRLAEAQARLGCWSGVGAVAGAVTTTALVGSREKLRMRGPHLLLGRGLCLFALHCPGRRRAPRWGRAL